MFSRKFPNLEMAVSYLCTFLAPASLHQETDPLSLWPLHRAAQGPHSVEAGSLDWGVYRRQDSER